MNIRIIFFQPENTSIINVKLSDNKASPAGVKIVILIQTLFMEKNEKGLADTQEGEFVLNESGTTVSTDLVEGVDVPALNEPELKENKDSKQGNKDLEQEKQ